MKIVRTYVGAVQGQIVVDALPLPLEGPADAKGHARNLERARALHPEVELWTWEDE